MRTTIKIYTVILLAALAVGASTYTYGQAKKKTKKASGITLGFQAGREILFNSSPLIHSRQSKVHYGISKSFVLRKSIGTHFNAETRLNDVFYPSAMSVNGFNKGVNKFAASKINIPLTLQYHPLCCGAKIDPFVGMGLQYNFNTATSNQSNPELTFQNTNAGTKYFSILFTQGVTYEINTKIDVDESIHFIPGTGSKSLGFNVGIGYKLP